MITFRKFAKVRVAFRYLYFIVRGFLIFPASVKEVSLLANLNMQQFKLNIVNRENTGRGVARRLRAEGKIPASLYGQGKARSITVAAVDFRNLKREIGDGSAIIELTDEKGVTALSLVQDVQLDAMRDTVDHIDFQEVERGHSFVTQLAVHLKGESDAVGVKNSGGLIDHKTHTVEIRCRPSALPDHVEMNVSALDIGDALHVSELPVLEGVEYLDDPEQVIVSCQAPTIAVETSDEVVEEVGADEVPASKVKADDDAE